MTSEPEFQLWDKHPLLEKLRFFDIEASGLHEGSYPLQFGWCGIDLKTSDILVRPEPDWTEDLYAPQSFEIHGIAYETAMKDGIAAVDAARSLNTHFDGTAVICDSPSWDGYWTTRLSDTTGVPLLFGLNDFGNMANTFGSIYDRWSVANYHRLLEAVDTFYPHTHRAPDDAQRMGALTRMFIDREWAEWLLERQAFLPKS